MLDRLPTELLLVIAELAAPQTAHSRLRPLIHTEIWIFDEDEASALASALERDPTLAPFTKRLICSYISANNLEELGRVFPLFNNVRSVDIDRSGTKAAPLELSTIERLGALTDLSLEECWVAPTLPRLDQLETLCLCYKNLVVQPGKDVHLAPIRIITELSSASKRSLRLLEQDRHFRFDDADSPPPDFANLTLFELDVEGHLQALISVAPNLSALTLPLNLGIGSDEIAEARAHIYEFLKQFVKTKIPIHFHNEPRDMDEHIPDPDFKTLDEFDGEGYFSDLVEGKVDDPELRNFRVMVV